MGRNKKKRKENKLVREGIYINHINMEKKQQQKVYTKPPIRAQDNKSSGEKSYPGLRLSLKQKDFSF